MLLLLACTEPDVPDERDPLPAASLVIDHVAIVDADGRRENRAVVVADGKVERVMAEGEVWPDDAEVIDGSALTLIPGLVDSHVHLALAGTTVAVGDMLEVNLRATVAAGVTEVVDLGGPPALFALRDAIDRGDAIGPRIHATGPFLSVPGSHPCESFPDPALCIFVTPEDAGSVAAAQVAAGADAIKVAVADASFTPWGATPRIDLESLDAIDAVGVPVYAHVDEDEDVIDAVAHGVDILAHPVFSGAMGAEALEAASRVPTESTLSAFANTARLLDGELVAPDPAIAENWALLQAHPELFVEGWVEENAAWTEAARGNLQALRSAGAQIIPGSDAGYLFIPHGTGLIDELDALVDLGWTPLEALTAATLEARETLGVDGGRVEAGAPADLVLVHGDPSADLGALREVARVFLGGVPWTDEDLIPSPLDDICLEAWDCPDDMICDGTTHACGGWCEAPYATASACGADAWCMPWDGQADSESGVCHVEAACDLYAQDCAPELYGLACVPYDSDTTGCWFGGPRQAGQSCTWTDADYACEPGLFCSWLDSRCYTLCDPEGPDSCAVGACQQQFAEDGSPWFGLCL